MSKQTNFPQAEYKLTDSVQFLVCVVTVVVWVRGVEGQRDAGGEDGHQDEVLEGLGESSNTESDRKRGGASAPRSICGVELGYLFRI